MCQLDSLGSRHWDRHGGAKVCKRAGHMKEKKASDHLVQSLTMGCRERNLTMAWHLSQIWKKPAERGCPVTSLSQLDSYSFFEEMWCEFQCISVPVMVRHLHLESQPIRRESLHGSGLPPSKGDVQEWLSLMKQTLSPYLILELPRVFIISLLHNSL